MKRRKEQNVNEALWMFLRESGLETPLLHHRLVQSWADLVGEPFSHHSQALEVRGEVLWVSVDSPALITELSMQRTSLVGRLNQHVGAVLINDIRFLCANVDK